MSDELERDRGLLLPYLDDIKAWREFGASETCTNSQDGHRCVEPGDTIIAFVVAGGHVEIATFCKPHAARMLAVLRSEPERFAEQASERWRGAW